LNDLLAIGGKLACVFEVNERRSVPITAALQRRSDCCKVQHVPAPAADLPDDEGAFHIQAAAASCGVPNPACHSSQVMRRRPRAP
jgi:hypothetical protein